MIESELKKELRSEALLWDADKAAIFQRWQRYYQIAIGALFVVLLAVSVVFVSSNSALKHSLAELRAPVPILLHEFDDGTVAYASVPKSMARYKDSNRQIESDLYHYVKLRESYLYTSVEEQFDESQAQSTPEVTATMMKQLNKDRIPYYGAKGYQKVNVNEISIISKKSKSKGDNVAQVHYSTFDSNTKKWVKRVAMIGWDYTEPSYDAAVRWHNPLGFIVTRFDVSDYLTTHGD